MQITKKNSWRKIKEVYPGTCPMKLAEMAKKEGFRLTILKKNEKGIHIIYEAEKEGIDLNVCEYDNGDVKHFIYINNLNIFANSTYLCPRCHTGYKTKKSLGQHMRSTSCGQLERYNKPFGNDQNATVWYKPMNKHEAFRNTLGLKPFYI